MEGERLGITTVPDLRRLPPADPVAVGIELALRRLDAIEAKIERRLGEFPKSAADTFRGSARKG